MAPVLKRRMIDSTGSTSSMRHGPGGGSEVHQPAQGASCFDWSSTSAVYSLKTR